MVNRTHLRAARQKGVTLVELMIAIALVGILMMTGPTLLLDMARFWQVQLARSKVQKSARNSLDLVNRLLRQSSSSTVVVSQRTNQPPFSWITFSIDKGTGTLIGQHGFYQEGKYLKYMSDGSTSTLADNLRYMAFSYPRSDDPAIISVSMTFEEATYRGYTNALQLSIEKVRIMN